MSHEKENQADEKKAQEAANLFLNELGQSDSYTQILMEVLIEALLEKENGK